MSEKTTVIERGHLFEGADGDDFITRVADNGEFVGSSSVANLVPDDARDWSTGRFEITVKFIKEEKS